MMIKCSDCGDEFPPPVGEDNNPELSITTGTIVRGTTSRLVFICPTCADKL